MLTRYCTKCHRPIRTKLELDGEGKFYHQYCLWGFLSRGLRKLNKLRQSLALTTKEGGEDNEKLAGK